MLSLRLMLVNNYFFNVSPNLHIFITTIFFIKLFILFGCRIKNKIKEKLGPLPKTVEEAVRVRVPQIIATEVVGQLFLSRDLLKLIIKGVQHLHLPCSVKNFCNFLHRNAKSICFSK